MIAPVSMCEFTGALLPLPFFPGSALLGSNKVKKTKQNKKKDLKRCCFLLIKIML